MDPNLVGETPSTPPSNSGSHSSPATLLNVGETKPADSRSPSKRSFKSKPPLSRLGLVSPLSTADDSSGGSSSGVKSTSSPDPRWPYLHRWSGGQTAPVAAIESSAAKSTTPQASQDIAPIEKLVPVLSPPVDMRLLEAEAPALQPIPATETVAPPPCQGSLPHGPSPSLGAWNNKLNLLAAPLALGPTVDQRMWPPLGASKSIRPEPQVFQKPVGMEDDIRFPWAAKMNPSSRNLYRALEPEYLEDGTPKVIIPHHVLAQGLENQKEYILGQFYRCSPPPGGLIFAVVNHLWGRTCKITIRKLGDCSYLFHIPDESTRTWVLQRGLWHVDDCLMFVAPWTPEPSLAIPEIKTIPVWVTLKKIPSTCYSISGISHIASGLGAPLKTHKPRLDPFFTGEAKILVEVELSKAFPPRIAAEDKTGFICMVDVEYAWVPSKCARCGQLGHKVKRCLQSGLDSSGVVKTTTKAPVVDDNVCNVVTTSNPTEDSTSASAQFYYVPAPVTEVPPCDPITIAPSTAIVPSTQSVVHPTIISEKPIESPTLGAATTSLVTTDIIAQEKLTVPSERERLIEPDLGSNKFASLSYPEVEEDSSDSDKDSDKADFMTPAGKRILRDRPVKPSTKAKEMHWQSTARGRGHRGRGGRG